MVETAILGLFSLYFCLFNTVVNNVQLKFSPGLDSNRGPMVSEATALPTEPQPLPEMVTYIGILE